MEETNGLLVVERIEQMCKEKHLSREDVAKAGRIAPNTLSTWKSRGTIPPADTAIYIARYLDVGVEWLIFGKEEDAPHLGDWEKELLEACAPFDQRDKEDLLQTARAKSDRYTSSSETKMA